MDIQVLGHDSDDTQNLMQLAQDAVRHTGVSAQVTRVTDYEEIAGYGVLSTPGLVIDGELKVFGRVPAREEIVALIRASS